MQLYGKGWPHIDEFHPHAAGPIESRAEKHAALAGATILVDLWPWRAGHPITAIDRPILRRDGPSLPSFIQRARQLMTAGTVVTPPPMKALSAELLLPLLPLAA
jgi:hypothetical protein